MSPKYEEVKLEFVTLGNVCTPASDIGTVWVPTVTVFLTVSRDIKIPPFDRTSGALDKAEEEEEEEEEEDNRKRPPPLLDPT